MRSWLYSGGDAQGDPAKLWWVFIVTGSLWILFSLLLFRFSYASVTAISILMGVVCLAAAIEELVLIPTAHGWWRLGRVVLAVAFAVIAIVAFVHPGNTFSALAAIFAFYLLLNGLLAIVLSLDGVARAAVARPRERARPRSGSRSGRRATSGTRRSCCSSSSEPGP